MQSSSSPSKNSSSSSPSRLISTSPPPPPPSFPPPLATAVAAAAAAAAAPFRSGAAWKASSGANGTVPLRPRRIRSRLVTPSRAAAASGEALALSPAEISCSLARDADGGAGGQRRRALCCRRRRCGEEMTRSAPLGLSFFDKKTTTASPIPKKTHCETLRERQICPPPKKKRK